ncbi:transcriptional regulator [Streptococcus parauberis]|uniref:transcriptional regulator n=1 Tax=Streptococcus parauberis TaxID=1348 RepID=UPI00378F562E
MKQQLYSDAQYKAFDEWLLNYRHIDSKIARRKLEIETFHATDANIGGGKSNIVIKRTECLVEHFDSDTKLNSLYAFKEAAERLRNSLDNELQQIFRLRWISGNSWEDIEYQLELKPRQMNAKRMAILNLFADVMGI